jgi:threonine/homoserine/homoserine lactone efflux protein
LGLRSLLSKKKEKNSSVMHYLSIDSQASNLAKFRRYFTLGFLTFLLNFSTAIFVLAAGRQIGLVKAGLTTDVTATFILTIIALLVIELPLLFFILLPQKAEKVIEPMNQWLSKHTNLVMAAFLLIIGVLVIYNGLSRLHMV